MSQTPQTNEAPRSIVRGMYEGDDAEALWWPDPPRDGDVVYRGGAPYGIFRGDFTRPGGWYVLELPREGGAT